MSTSAITVKFLCRLLPGLLLLTFTSCSTISRTGNFWTINDCPADPKDRDMLPECARKLKKTSPPVQMIDALKRASAFNSDTGSLNRIRKYYQASSLPNPGDDMEITSQNLTLDERDIPLRLYTPAAAKNKLLPVVIYLHGGGWCFGSAADTDDISVGLSRAIPAIVVSVDYRLAPENPFPAGLDDACAAITWAVKNAEQYHGDARNIYLAGDSAGGNMAAAAALKNKVDNGADIRGVILFYPPLNLFKPATFSWKRFESGYGMDTILANELINCYIPDLRRRNQHFASPVFADMRYMPPTLIFSAQFDIFRDDARKFSERMKAQGSRIRYVCVPGVTHGYLQDHALKKEYVRTMDDAAEFVRLTLSAGQ